MKKARRMLAWALVVVLGLTNVDYVRAEEISGKEFKTEAVTPEVSGGDQAEIYSMSSGTSDDPDGDITVLYSGSESGVTWEITSNGVLTISGEKTEGTLSPSWKNYNKDFTKVVITAKNIVSTNYWFAFCDSITEFDMSGFDTSNVKDMSGMFRECFNLKSLDVKGFDTSNVKDMSSMFSGCSSLESLDVSGFDTSNVTDMNWMFGGCTSLKSLDVSSFDTSHVKNMGGMFCDCSSLESLDVSGFDTQSAWTPYDMFAGCYNIVTLKTFRNLKVDVALPVRMCDEQNQIYEDFPLNLSESIYLYADDSRTILNSGSESGVIWEISADGVLTISGKMEEGAILDMRWQDRRNLFTKVVITVENVDCTDCWFEGCSKITEIDMSNFDTAKVTSMIGMFADCSSLTSLDVSGFETGNVENMRDMFAGCSSLTSLNVNGFDTQKVTDMSYLFEGCSGLTSLNVGDFDTSNVKDMCGMFAGCDGLTSLDVRTFVTNTVTDMSMMFYGCSGLTSLDVSSFDTKAVTSMWEMFYGCSNLTSLDVSNFDTGSVNSMSEMFSGCSKIVQMKTFPNLAQDVDLPVRMCDEQNHIYEKFPLNLPEGIYLYADDSRTVLNSGSESGVTWEISEDGVLTIAGEKSADTPKLSMRWLERKYAFTKVVITAGNIDSTAGWFEGCDNITEIDLSGFDTETVTDMRRMFFGCSGITMLKTFPNLQKKIALPVKMQDTDRKVYESFPMGLAESIILYRYENESEFGVTWEITDDGILVISGTKLEGAPSPTGEAWKALKDQFTKVVITAENIDSTAGWFEGCDNITEIDLSGFDTGKVTDMSRMFYGCSGLTNLDVSGLDIKSVTDMSDMFSGCSGITTLKTFTNLQKEVALPVKMRDVAGTVYESFPTGLAEGIILHGYDYGNESGVEWEITDDGILMISGAKVESAPSPTGEAWKALKEKFTKVVVTAENIDSTAGWFEGCSNITEIDLSGFDTGKVTDMSRMFYGCSGLTNLDVSGLDIKSVTDMSDMFSGCSGVTKIKVFRNLQLEKIALPLAEMYDEKGSCYQWFPTGLAESIYLYVEKGSDPPIVDPPIVDPPVDTQKGLRVELVHPDKTYTYDGSAHKPEIMVYNGDRLLTEGTDYTVKYSNNVKAVTSATAKKKMPTITVTGKGRFTGKTDATFTIKQCSLNDVMISGLVKGSENTIMVVSGTKASPVLVYNGMKLGAKDYSIDKANVRFTADTADKTIVISAKNNGNYKGELRLNVEVVPKENLKKITSVTVEKETISYDGKEHTPASITVKAGKDDITNVEDAYTIVYYGDKTTAGTQKFTVIGLGAYTGSVTKSYTIQPRKAALDVTNQLEKDGRVVCVFDGAGVTFNDKLIVKDREFNKFLEQGRDYKVTYSGNKKVGVEKAKYTITFMGNYKGNAAVKKSFTIEKAPLNNDTVTVSAIDKVYNQKGIYKSSVYVINKVTGVALKSSDYKVEYFIDQEMNKPMNRQNQVELGTDDAAYGIVYVKVTGRGNYTETTYATGSFKVCKKSTKQTDISKAKVAFYADGRTQSKVEYTGEAVYPERIEIKISSEDKKILKPDENGNWDSDANFSVEFLNNVEKGKATVIIRAKDGSDYVGSKNAVFSVAPRNLGNLEDFWKNILGLL